MSDRLTSTVELRSAAPPAGDVAVFNGSDHDVRLFNLGNSWGDDAWSFELGGAAVRRRPQSYTRNVPSARTIAPDATERFSFDFGDGTWEADAAEGKPVAVYHAPPTPEAKELGIFTGPLRSS